MVKTLLDNRRENTKTEWLTDPNLLKKLGDFDLDPCSPVVPPWKIAEHTFTILDDGLKQDWFGRVWLNPPYGKETYEWIRKLTIHNNGIALIFARTETKLFRDFVWKKASSIYFFGKRLYFYNVDGTKPKFNAGAPSCLISFGSNNDVYLEALEKDKDYYGKYIKL